VNKFIKLIVSIAICLLAGGLGTIFTVSSIPTWYATLVKPSFSPPNWLFGPVWTLLYILMGISLYLIWKKGTKTQKVREDLMLFGLQLFLNAIWSPIFFGAKNLFISLIVIIFMWLFIFRTILSFGKINKTASYLLYPYLAWVSFASLLNFSVWMLNK